MLYIRYLITGLIILLLSIAIVPLMSISQITPDLMLIFVVYVALKNGQIAGSVAGFISGLLLDYTVDFTPGFLLFQKRYVAL
jgi:rod shape-determining protein MreD